MAVDSNGSPQELHGRVVCLAGIGEVRLYKTGAPTSFWVVGVGPTTAIIRRDPHIYTAKCRLLVALRRWRRQVCV